MQPQLLQQPVQQQPVQIVSSSTASISSGPVSPTNSVAFQQTPQQVQLSTIPPNTQHRAELLAFYREKNRALGQILEAERLKKIQLQAILSGQELIIDQLNARKQYI
jgi:hypothetical protein